MIFCFDCDGTLTTNSGFGASSLNIPWQILWVILFFYKPKINNNTLELIKNIKERGHTVIIITARPKELERLTKKYLKRRNVPYDKIFFMSPGPDSGVRKIKKIKAEKVDFFFDNNKKIIKLANEEGIYSFLV